ncbi:cytochrome C oxidase subunit IV family protein [Methylobacterium radiotolerans]|uniref:cytochrome C oxidase subunit IV family protein n=1 Tax=Methylobacterium radiotolerans TaxID=31998 RepID=UPI0006AFF91F|nr:cytochrome C oxidase subunit IV family protein [Methylobacterium radiotolerans]UIY45422.1 cytochrome C oxidase subunit IV family protein [Methylobacterium radiotolerans]
MSAPVSAGAIWRRVLLVWLGLMALLAVGCALAYAPLGAWNPAVSFALAATQAGLVALLFMRLVRAPALIRLTAACGLFWSAILFTLTLADVLSRLART